MSLYVLCYPRFSFRDQAAIEDFREAHEPHRARLVRSHFTLVFGTNALSEVELTAHARRVARSRASFDVTLAHTRKDHDVVSGEYKLYLMASQGAEKLSKLHSDLHAGSLRHELRADLPFFPHITIASSTTEAALEQAQQMSLALPCPMQATVDGMTVAAFSDGELRELSRITF